MVSALAVLVDSNPLLAVYLVKHVPPDTTMMVRSTLAKSVMLDTVAQHQHVLFALLVVTVMALPAPTAVLDNTLLKAPRSVYSALAALAPMLEELLALNVLLVPTARLLLLPHVKLAELVLFPRWERMSAPRVSQALSRMELSAPLALSTPSLLILGPRRVLHVSQDLPHLERRVLLNAVAVFKDLTSTPPLALVSSVLLATTRIVQAREPARSVPLVNSAMLLEPRVAIPVLRVNISLSQALLLAVHVQAELSPLPARVLARSAPRVNSLLLELLLALVALLDTTQTSLGLGLVQHVRLGPNAQALPSPPPLSVLLALSSPSLLRLRVHRALRSRMHQELGLQSA
jgi:hypothetical protein